MRVFMVVEERGDVGSSAVKMHKSDRFLGDEKRPQKVSISLLHEDLSRMRHQIGDSMP